MKPSRFKGTATATIVIFAVSGIAISVLGFRQVERLTTSPAWIASSDLQAGQVITEDQLHFGRGKKAELAVKEPRQLVGRKLKIDKDEGDIFLASDLASEPRSWLAQKAPEGRVLYTLVPEATSIPFTQVRNGDRLDILAKGPRGVRTVAQNVLMVGSMTPPGSAGANGPSGRGLLTQLAAQPPSKKSDGKRSGVALILAVAPTDVYPLAGIGTMEEVTLVLHGEYEVRKGELLQIKPEPTRRRVQLFMGNSRENVIVNRSISETE